MNRLISCGTSKYWKLQKVTGNSMLRTYEKFGNTLFDGLWGWFAPILVTKGDYFLIIINYSKILKTVIMTKTVLRSPVWWPKAAIVKFSKNVNDLKIQNQNHY